MNATRQRIHEKAVGRAIDRARAEYGAAARELHELRRGGGRSEYSRDLHAHYVRGSERESDLQSRARAAGKRLERIEALLATPGAVSVLLDSHGAVLSEAELSKDQHNYHYIRYIALFIFVSALTQLHQAVLVAPLVSPVRLFLIALLVLCVVIDWRNHYLFKSEEGLPLRPGPVSVATNAFYLLVLTWLLLGG